MAESGPAIMVEELTKYYDDLLAVDHVSFDVARGEFLGFLGPNGAGKTTTIRMLTNLTTPSSGEGSILGYPIGRNSIRLRESIGVVPENPNVFAEFTSLDNLLFTAEIYGVPRARRKARANELLSLFGLEDKARVKADSLSMGLKRRLSIAMGLLHDPDLLFLDEPTNGLDVHSAVVVRGILRDLNRAGKTMFYTTHNLVEANELCQRIVVIDKGKVIAIDSPQRLKRAANRSQHVEVSFEGKPPEGAARDLGSLEGVGRVTLSGDRFRLSTSDPSVVLESVCSYIESSGERVSAINTLGPTLEDVFIEITESRE